MPVGPAGRLAPSPGGGTERQLPIPRCGARSGGRRRRPMAGGETSAGRRRLLGCAVQAHRVLRLTLRRRRRPPLGPENPRSLVDKLSPLKRLGEDVSRVEAFVDLHGPDLPMSARLLDDRKLRRKVLHLPRHLLHRSPVQYRRCIQVQRRGGSEVRAPAPWPAFSRPWPPWSLSLP